MHWPLQPILLKRLNKLKGPHEGRFRRSNPNHVRLHGAHDSGCSREPGKRRGGYLQSDLGGNGLIAPHGNQRASEADVEGCGEFQKLLPTIINAFGKNRHGERDSLRKAALPSFPSSAAGNQLRTQARSHHKAQVCSAGVSLTSITGLWYQLHVNGHNRVALPSPKDALILTLFYGSACSPVQKEVKPASAVVPRSANIFILWEFIFSSNTET